MVIKNAGEKIVHIGSVTILPDQTASLPDRAYSAPVNALLRRGALAVVKEKPVRQENPQKAVNTALRLGKEQS